MERVENRKELINLIIVYAIELLIMICLGTATTKLAETGVNIPTIIKSIFIYAMLFIPVIVYSKKKGDSFFEVCRLKKIKVSTFFLTVLLTLVSAPMYIFANILSQFFVPNVLVQSLNDMMDGTAGLTLLAISVLAPICEEMICRGFFQNRLKEILPFFASALVSGIMFGALHLNLNQFCYAVVLGVLFAYVNRASGSIITSLIMHFLVNAGNMLILISAQQLLSSMGGDLGQTAEMYRADKSLMASSAAFYGVLAVIAFFLSRLIIKAIAKREQTEEITEAVLETAE